MSVERPAVRLKEIAKKHWIRAKEHPLNVAAAGIALSVGVIDTAIAVHSRHPGHLQTWRLSSDVVTLALGSLNAGVVATPKITEKLASLFSRSDSKPAITTLGLNS